MDHIELHRGGREEAFPETAEDWPYIAERAEFARYPGNSVPWHWHSEVELFYMEQGAIDYRTRATHEHARFEEGSAGFINGGVLHSTLQSPNSAPAIQMLHIFQPSMLGDPAGRLQKRYINPLLQCRGVDVLKWSPTNPDDMPFIDLLKSSFNHDLQRPQNEMALRNSLSELWIQIYVKAEPLFSSDNASWMTNRDVQFKAILDYIRANYAAAIDVPQMASAAGVSERECYRIIEACAGTTPAAYLRAYRVNRFWHTPRERSRQSRANAALRQQAILARYLKNKWDALLRAIEQRGRISIAPGRNPTSPSSVTASNLQANNREEQPYEAL